VDEFVTFVDEHLIWSRGQAAHVKKIVTAPSAVKAADDKKENKFCHQKGSHGQKEAK